MPKPVHFEIPAENPERATKFFTDVFGWQFNSWGADQGYWLATTGAEGEMGIDGAVMKRRDPAQPIVNSINVDSVDSYAEKIVAAGGQIVVPKMVVPSMGYVAYFKDTEGNIHGLWQHDPNAK
jgi:predicted enzyme related to lactoylglutathione lyase